MTYDDAGWYSDYTDELGLDLSAGGIHIAGFLVWACRNGLLLEDQFADAIAAAEDEEGTPTDFIFKYFDSQLDPSMLTRHGNLFTDRHYDDYLDRSKKLPYVAAYPVPAAVPDTWETAEVYGTVLDELYAEFTEE